MVGTLGGFIYAIDPDVEEPATNALIHYSETDYGWGVVGLDIGDVTGDGVNEIVAGTWVDDGSYEDYSSGVPDKHRGHVIIAHLNTSPSADLNAFGVEDEVITLNDGVSPGPFSPGVLGVKIDDVNADGKPEIWCGDAKGRLYCLTRDSWPKGPYVAFYRSASLGAYPGIANNIYPVKDELGRTTSLVVFTSGYVYRFQVDFTLVP